MWRGIQVRMTRPAGQLFLLSKGRRSFPPAARADAYAGECSGGALMFVMMAITAAARHAFDLDMAISKMPINRDAKRRWTQYVVATYRRPGWHGVSSLAPQLCAPDFRRVCQKYFQTETSRVTYRATVTFVASLTPLPGSVRVIGSAWRDFRTRRRISSRGVARPVFAGAG